VDIKLIYASITGKKSDPLIKVLMEIFNFLVGAKLLRPLLYFTDNAENFYAFF
jgi:hypothetical protein